MQKNHQHLPQASVITVQHVNVLIRTACNLQLFISTELPAAAHCIMHNIDKVQRSLFNRKICILQTRQIQQIIYQSLQKQAFLIHLLMEFLYIRLFSNYTVAQGLQTAADNRYRRAQLMRNVGNKLAAQLFQLLAFGICQLQTFCQNIKCTCQLTDFIILLNVGAGAIITFRQTLGNFFHFFYRAGKAPAEHYRKQHAQSHCHQQADKQNAQTGPDSILQSCYRRMQQKHSLYLSLAVINRSADSQHNAIQNRIIFFYNKLFAAKALFNLFPDLCRQSFIGFLRGLRRFLPGNWRHLTFEKAKAAMLMMLLHLTALTLYPVLIDAQLTVTVHHPNDFLRYIIQIADKFAVGNTVTVTAFHTLHIITQHFGNFLRPQTHFLFLDFNRLLLEELVKNAADNQRKNKQHRRKIQCQL